MLSARGAEDTQTDIKCISIYTAQSAAQKVGCGRCVIHKFTKRADHPILLLQHSLGSTSKPCWSHGKKSIGTLFQSHCMCDLSLVDTGRSPLGLWFYVYFMKAHYIIYSRSWQRHSENAVSRDVFEGYILGCLDTCRNKHHFNTLLMCNISCPCHQLRCIYFGHNVVIMSKAQTYT